MTLSPGVHRRPSKRRRALWIGACVLTTISSLAVLKPALAATGCGVDYQVTNQWTGGFQGSVTLTNLGDPTTEWNLAFSFPDANQKITQGWNATWTQSGTAVTAKSLSYNGSIATGAKVNIGFTGTWTSANPVPAKFTINGTTCTGSVATSSPTTASPTPSTTTSATPSPTGTADPWNPPSTLVSPLAAVWSHEESTYSDLYGFKNYGWDQLVANGGTINYCVRWDSTAHVTATQRDAVQVALQKQYQKWMDAMLDNGQGWNKWPYKNVALKVVGWAVRDRSQLEWTDDSVDVYVNDINEDAPQCGAPCGRFFHQDGNYSGCTGGKVHHYDNSLWLTAGFSGGAGGDWGQRIGSEYFMSNLTTDNIHILLHEMGHTYGLDDFYDWDPLNGTAGFLMMAGSATQITDFDKWMLRDFWRHLKSRYGL